MGHSDEMSCAQQQQEVPRTGSFFAVKCSDILVTKSPCILELASFVEDRLSSSVLQEH